MAGRQLTDAILKKAVELHCAATGKQASEGEDHGVKRILLFPGDVKVSQLDGKLVCEDEATKQALAEIIMMMPEEEDPKAEEKALAPTNGKPASGFNMDGWRQKQDRSYSVAGKQAPNAFAVSEEANRRGLCSQIMDSGRTKDLVWGHVRVTDPRTGQFREDRVSHGRETFTLLKAWEDANSQARFVKGKQLIVGIQDNNMPQLDSAILIKGMPAPLWLTMSVMRSWSFADRDAITKAERRAQLKMLNREWREDDEITLELEEEKAVQDSRARA